MPSHRRTEAGEPAPAAGLDRCAVCEVVREADHRIANHLALLAGFVRLKASDLAHRPSGLGGGEVQLALDAISSQIVAVGRLHRSLTRDAAASVDVSEHLHDISASLSLLRGDIDIIEDFADGCLVQPEQILPLTQIASEVFTNAIKYARPGHGRTSILARCSQDSDGRVQIEIADNGTGLPDEFDPALNGGLGYRLLRAFAKQLQARMEFESSGAGLRFRLTLPPSLPAIAQAQSR